MKTKFSFCVVIFLTLFCACVDKEEDGLYMTEWESATGFPVDGEQNWISGKSCTVDVTTDGGALISACSLGHESRTLYGQRFVDGKGTLKFDLPLSGDSCFAIVYFDGESYDYRRVDISAGTDFIFSVDFTNSATRALSSIESSHNSVLDGTSSTSTANGYAGHNYGYSTFPGWTWDNIAAAVPETKNPNTVQGSVYDYELISNGPFYISMLYGYTGTPDPRILGYYYHTDGDYSDFTMVDIVDVVDVDYIDGKSKVQYQVSGDNTWYDANFDYMDGDGSMFSNKQNAKKVERRGDQSYNTYLLNEAYKGKVSAVRGLTFQINVPEGKKMGFYLRGNIQKDLNNGQRNQLVKLGITNLPEDFYSTSFSNPTFNNNARNQAHRSVVKVFDSFTFMGLDDNPTGGDHDSNDVTFGLLPGNGGSMPGILLPDAYDLVKKQYYNLADGTYSDQPQTPSPVEQDIKNPSIKALSPWTLAYEDLKVGDPGFDYDFNDVVIRVVPYTDNQAEVWLLAAGGTLETYLHFDGSEGDVNLGEVHTALGGGDLINTSGVQARIAPCLLGKVLWSEDYSIVDDGSRFYIEVINEKGEIHTVHSPSSKEAGQTPHAICVCGEWKWPKEKTRISEAYPNFGYWGSNYQKAEFWNWHQNPNLSLVVLPYE